MSQKHRATGPSATAADRNGPDGSGLESGRAPHRFQANVFTWAGPGVENIFIDFEPAKQCKPGESWKDADRDDRGEPAGRPVDNIG